MNGLLSSRYAGVLLHPTSLPGNYPQGQLGHDAFHFIDFIQQCGFGAWQMLPLEPTGDDRSPYQSTSAFAGNIRLISPEILANQGLIRQQPEQLTTIREYQQMVAEVWEQIQRPEHATQRAAFEAFKKKQSHWLRDYALFSAIKERQQQRPWPQWPEGLKQHDPEALNEAEQALDGMVNSHQLAQFLFFDQWQALKHYANKRNIKLIGDLAIFVSHDSADVWSNQTLFNLDHHGQPKTVAGVPPDYFSETGQRWGNPHYRWTMMEQNRFEWWNRRVSHMLNSFDLIRIDHFRGFESYWEIPAAEKTAINGHWVEAPGQALFETLQQHHPHLPFIAEDLGVITEAVIKLRMQFKLPGMKILQFAFNDGADNPYLPHNHAHNSVVYTGTHDNNTTVGWFNEIDDRQRNHVLEYLGHPQESMPWPLIRAALASVSSLAVLPMQDLLALDQHHRFNTPGTTTGNWQWRFQWEWVPENLAAKLKHLLAIYDRLPTPEQN